MICIPELYNALYFILYRFRISIKQHANYFTFLNNTVGFYPLVISL